MSMTNINHSDLTSDTKKQPGATGIEDSASTVVANLNKLLEIQNISAKELSEQTNYSESAISKYRTGKQFPPLDFLYKLKILFRISLDDFIFKEINRVDIHAQIPLSAAEKDEKRSYDKFCGTYLVYYLNTSSYKGRDKNTPEESLLYGILTISEDKTNIYEHTYNSIAVLGIKCRDMATQLKKTIDSMKSYYDIEKYISNDESLVKKAYFGDFEFSAEHAFLTLTHDRKDKALIILHRVNRNKKEYIGGMGTINSVSKGREPTPTAQYIALSRYPISLSAEEIHHQLLLSHPTYKADANAKELISLFKKTYQTPDSYEETIKYSEILTDLQKEIIIKVNLERYVKTSLTNNMFRYAKISERDDGAWYDLLKDVSIKSQDNVDIS